MEYPKLRPIEAFPVDASGKEGICLRDPSSLTDKMVVVPYHVLEIVKFFDGQHSILDIQTAYARQYGQILFREQLEDIINKLDESMLLDSERFRQFMKNLRDEFRRSGQRKAAFAGTAYESDPERLRSQLDSFFVSDSGPGRAASTGSGRKTDGSLKGAVLPHIDMGRGGPCFAWGYKEIEESASARCFLVFGTSHGETDGLFTLTKKDFETPFGILRTDREIVDALEKKGGKSLFRDEFAHKTEHSIEFQAVFLRYLYDDTGDISMVPVLCSSFHEMIGQGVSPSSVQEVDDFIGTLRHAVEKSGREVCLLASADLSHVGPRFGDPAPVTPQHLKEVAREDGCMIEFIEAVDAEGFFFNVQKDGDRRRICGLSPIYTLLKAIGAERGKLIKYEQWPDPMGMVSFASICFY